MELSGFLSRRKKGENMKFKFQTSFPETALGRATWSSFSQFRGGSRTGKSQVALEEVLPRKSKEEVRRDIETRVKALFD